MVFSFGPILQMSTKQINYESEYKSLKNQYDSLLEKNQNDLIKIKQKEKHLSEELDRLKNEKAAIESQHAQVIKSLHEEIESGKRKHEQGQLTVSVVSKEEERIKELEMDMRSLIDKNIALTAENTSLKHESQGYIGTSEGLELEIERLKEYVSSIQRELRELKDGNAKKQSIDQITQTEGKVASEEEVAALKEQLGKAHKELDHLTTVGQDLRQKVRHLEEESKLISDRERKSLNLLKKREGELSLAQGEIDKLKYATKSGKRKTESEEAVCLKCKEHEQEIHLLKQMVKSTKGMVRVREIEVERYRMHNEEPSLKDNRSTGKINEKTPSLPPLKKKQLE